MNGENDSVGEVRPRLKFSRIKVKGRKGEKGKGEREKRRKGERGKGETEASRPKTILVAVRASG
jgi:hypothetical protein